MVIALLVTTDVLAGAKTYGDKKGYTWEQQIRRGEREKPNLVTARRVFMGWIGENLVCIYVGPGKTNEVITTLKNEENDEIQPTIKEEDSRERKRKIIDSFIETNPKISAIKPAQSEKKKIIKELPYSSESLMTETLARVYVEQKNFKKAKQAYRILSLKYPEKSGFFADQIRAVEQLEQQKD